MDPLSITASVASLVSGVASTVLGCKKLVNAYSEAPETLKSLHTELRAVQTTLSYIQMILSRDADKLETLLSTNGLLGDGFDISISGCSVVFTDLKREMDRFPISQPGAQYSWNVRLAAVWNESSMRRILDRIRGLTIVLQGLLTIVQTESFSRIEALLRQQQPALRSVRSDVESAASVRLDTSSELTRRNSIRTSIVASSLGTREFSFDNILVNSTAYRKAYNAWRQRVDNGNDLSVQSNSRTAVVPDPSGDQNDLLVSCNESEWLIDLSETHQSLVIQQTVHPDLAQLQDFIEARAELEAPEDEGQRIQGFASEHLKQHNSPGETTSISDDEKPSPKTIRSAASIPDSLNTMSLSDPSSTKPGKIQAFEILFLGRHNLERDHPIDLGPLWKLPGTPLRRSGGRAWHFSKRSRFAAVGDWIRTEPPTWSFQDCYETPKVMERSEINIATVAIDGSSAVLERLLSILPQGQIEKEHTPAGSPWISWRFTSWVSHPSYTYSGHRFITMHIRESRDEHKAHLRLKADAASDELVEELFDDLLHGTSLVLVCCNDKPLTECDNIISTQLRTRFDGPIVCVASDSLLTNESLPDDIILLHNSFVIDAAAYSRFSSVEDVQDFWHTVVVLATTSRDALVQYPIGTTIRCLYLDKDFIPPDSIARGLAWHWPIYFGKRAIYPSDEGSLSILRKQAHTLQHLVMEQRADVMHELQKVWDAPESHLSRVTSY